MDINGVLEDVDIGDQDAAGTEDVSNGDLGHPNPKITTPD
jgi:hypothetical protein